MTNFRTRARIGFTHYAFLLVVVLLAHSGRSEELTCSKLSEGIACRRNPIYTRCGDKGQNLCLPSDSQIRVLEDQTVLCSCTTKPKDDKEWSRMMKNVAEVTKAVLFGTIPINPPK